MNVSCFTGGMVETNGYLLEAPNGNLLIDAPAGVARWLVEAGIKVAALLLTHQHYDHVEDAHVIQQSGARLLAFSDYSQELTLETLGRSWGMPIRVEPYTVDQTVSHGEVLELCGLTIQVLHVPGHAVDGLAFSLQAQGLLFSGDTLFAGSIGRADLPGGNPRQLVDGIQRHLMSLPGGTQVLPGHGPATSIQREATSNPYLETP